MVPRRGTIVRCADERKIQVHTCMHWDFDAFDEHPDAKEWPHPVPCSKLTFGPLGKEATGARIHRDTGSYLRPGARRPHTVSLEVSKRTRQSWVESLAKGAVWAAAFLPYSFNDIAPPKPVPAPRSAQQASQLFPSEVSPRKHRRLTLQAEARLDASVSIGGGAESWRGHGGVRGGIRPSKWGGEKAPSWGWIYPGRPCGIGAGY